VQELAKWVVALSTLVGFGLTMGFNPALYGATADMLARNKQVAARMGWMVAGLVTGATVLFALFQSFNPTALVAVLQGDVDRALLSRAVDIVVGSVFVIAAAVLAAWALRVPTRPGRPQRVHAPDAPSITYFPLGLSCAIVGFTTLPIMYMTGRITTGLTDDIALRLAAYAVFLLALVGPFLALAWLWSRFPGVSGRVSSLYARAMHTDFRWASAAILAAGGLVFIGLGVFAGH
jgi:hypothetical protein